MEKEKKLKNTDVNETCVAEQCINDQSENYIIDNVFLRHLFLPGILIGLTILIYYPSLYFPFQFDDIANISKRFGIRFDNPLSRFWNSSRWFGDWLNSINFQLGRFEPFTYRCFNVLIHILAGLCVFYLIRDLCLYWRNKPFICKNATFIAFMTSGLFLLHPVQTQTISYVIQARLEGLASLAVIATILTYVKLVQARNIFVKGLLSVLLFAGCLIASGTKELVVVLPVLLLLVDWFFLSQQSWSLFKKRLWIFGLFAAFFITVVVQQMGTKFIWDVLSLKMNTGNNRGNILTAGAFDVITPWMFFISEFKVILHYMMIFFWPFNISVEYDWKIAQSFFNIDVIIPFMMLVAIWTFVIRSVWQRQHQVITFGLLWFFISIAPRTTIIPSPELICDYKTYLASVGMMFILAIPFVFLINFLWTLVRQAPAKFYTFEAKVGVLAVFMLMIGATAYERNKIWGSSVSFWEDNTKKASSKARVHNNLGVALSEVGRVDESIVAYKKAIELDGYYADPLSNLAVAYSLKGETDKAIESLRGAIHICPNYPEAYNNLGTLLLQKKMYDEAQQMLEIAIQLRPYYGKAYYNLARMHEEKGEHEKSWEFLKKATEGDLDTAEVFFKLGQMSLRVQKFQEAATAFERILQAGIEQQQADHVWFNLANAYYMLGQHERAQSVYERLVQHNPLDARYAYNLAETYFTRKDFVRAYEMFRKTTTLPQPLSQGFFRAANCLEQMNKPKEAQAFLNALLSLNAADDFKKLVQSEIKRIALQNDIQERVNARGGKSIGLNELNQVLAKHQKGNSASENKNTKKAA